MKIQFIDYDRLKTLAGIAVPTASALDAILEQGLCLKGLAIEAAAALLQVGKQEDIDKLLRAAEIIKQKIYGKRIVLFAPLYIGNRCSNNCVYCAFRKDNQGLKRVVLTPGQIRCEVESLLKEGHKRLLMLCGEEASTPFAYFLEALRIAYACRAGTAGIRRINAEIAPLEVTEFARLRQAGIGTYACFQETYDPFLYREYHPAGPKADFEYRLTVMDRAMQAGIDDVGIGALFGLADYRYDVLGLIAHAQHLEAEYGCGPHTVSVPRIQPASGAPLSRAIPHPVSDAEFRKIIAVIRIALPYTGIILTTRETALLRDELFRYGVSQVSAGSRTNPGAYADAKTGAGDEGSQFALGDHRSLDEVIAALIAMEYIPSFCTGCYRKGRVGHDFMDLAKPGLIQQYCMPNGLFTFNEYLRDFASPAVLVKGRALIAKMVNAMENKKLMTRTCSTLARIDAGAGDLYF